jgi:hypothetical protein
MVINKCLNQVSTQNLVSVSMYPNMLVISLSLALYHPKHNSNSTQIQLNFNSKQLQNNSTFKVFFLFELDLKTPSIFQNLLDCIFAFPSNHPRFLKIYSIAFFAKKSSHGKFFKINSKWFC